MFMQEVGYIVLVNKIIYVFRPEFIYPANFHEVDAPLIHEFLKGPVAYA